MNVSVRVGRQRQGRLGSDRVRGAGDRLVWSGRLGSARVVSRLVHLASDAFPPSLVLGVASGGGFESRRAGSSKTTRGGQVQVQALVPSSLPSSWKTSIKTIGLHFCVWARL